MADRPTHPLVEKLQAELARAAKGAEEVDEGTTLAIVTLDELRQELLATALQRDARAVFIRDLAAPGCPDCGETGDSDPGPVWVPCACVLEAVARLRHLRQQPDALVEVARANTELGGALVELRAAVEAVAGRLRANDQGWAADALDELLARREASDG